MIKSGIVRKIDNRGRLTLPKRIRDLLELDRVEILVEDDLLCVRKFNETKKATAPAP